MADPAGNDIDRLSVELAKKIGLPPGPYGEPDWRPLRDMIQWWQRCERIRDRSIAAVLTAALAGGVAIWNMLEPFMIETLRELGRRWIVG